MGGHRGGGPAAARLQVGDGGIGVLREIGVAAVPQAMQHHVLAAGFPARLDERLLDLRMMDVVAGGGVEQLAVIAGVGVFVDVLPDLGHETVRNGDRAYAGLGLGIAVDETVVLGIGHGVRDADHLAVKVYVPAPQGEDLAHTQRQPESQKHHQPIFARHVVGDLPHLLRSYDRALLALVGGAALDLAGIEVQYRVGRGAGRLHDLPEQTVGVATGAQTRPLLGRRPAVHLARPAHLLVPALDVLHGDVTHGLVPERGIQHTVQPLPIRAHRGGTDLTTGDLAAEPAFGIITEGLRTPLLGLPRGSRILILIAGVDPDAAVDAVPLLGEPPLGGLPAAEHERRTDALTPPVIALPVGSGIGVFRVIGSAAMHLLHPDLAPAPARSTRSVHRPPPFMDSRTAVRPPGSRRCRRQHIAVPS